MNRPRRGCSLTTVTVACLALAACSSQADDDATAPGSATTAPAPATLPITEHVLAPDALPGLTAEAPPTEQGPRAFAHAHDKEVAELRASGFVSGATVFFNGPRHAFAISVAGQYDSPSDARTEADRLFTSNAKATPGMRVDALQVPDVPGARAAVLQGAHGGRQYTGVELVFVDGSVLHEVFALAEASDFTVDDVVDAATDLHERVAGHPVS